MKSGLNGIVVASIGAACLGFASTAAASVVPPAFRDVDRDLAKMCALGDLTGVVSATLRGKTVYTKVCGLADRAKRTPMTAASKFKIFSISKSLTSTAVLALAEKNQWDLGAPVAQFLPELPAPWRSITLRQLLEHTSGVPDLTSDLLSAYQKTPEAGWDGAMRAVLAASANAPLVEPPGSKWRYNNFGYELLADLAERATGKPFPRVLDEEVLRPAGMIHTRVARPLIVDGRITGSQPIAGLSTGYACKTDGGKPLVSYSFVQMGAGAVITTAGDLARFDRAMRSGKLLSGGMQKRIVTEAFADTGGVPYGYGWAVRTSGAAQYLEHSGGNNGYVTDFARGVDLPFTATVMSNDSCTDVDKIDKALVAALVRQSRR